MSSQNRQNAERRKIVMEEMLASFAVQSCLNCEHFNEETAKCREADAVPPPSVAVFGCEMWEIKLPF